METYGQEKMCVLDLLLEPDVERVWLVLGYELNRNRNKVKRLLTTYPALWARMRAFEYPDSDYCCTSQSIRYRIYKMMGMPLRQVTSPTGRKDYYHYREGV